MKERYLHFDILKGIAILFVVLGHIYCFGIEGKYLHSIIERLLFKIQLPLFIFVSGYFSSKALDLSSKGIYKYWKGKAIRLLLPLLFLPVLFNFMINGVSFSLPFNLYVGKYWFTYHLFFLFCHLYIFRLGFIFLNKVTLVRKLGVGMELAYYLGTILIVRLLMHWNVFQSLNMYFSYYYINSLYKFLILGYLCSRIQSLEYFIRSKYVSATSFIMLVGLLYFEYTTYPSDEIGLYLGSGLTIISGIVFFYNLSLSMAKTNNHLNKVIAYIGKESLPIYLTHYFFLPFIPNIKYFLESTISNKAMIITWEFWIGVLGVAMTLVPTLLVIRIIKSNKYLAFLIYGEKIK